MPEAGASDAKRTSRGRWLVVGDQARVQRARTVLDVSRFVAMPMKEFVRLCSDSQNW